MLQIIMVEINNYSENFKGHWFDTQQRHFFSFTKLDSALHITTVVRTNRGKIFCNF